MLSDEEKEALRSFKSEYETCDHYSSDLIIELDDAEIILNLIEKQSKEIEEYNTKLLSNAGIYQLGFNDGKKSAEDKIKAKIEEYEKMKEATKMDTTYYGEKRRSVIEDLIAELQSLLEKE